MVLAPLLLTAIDHDLAISVASGFGLLGLTGVFVGLYKKRWFTLFGFGIMNLLLIVLNNYLYYSEVLIHYLPVVQKITFASFLLWIGLICYKMRVKEKSL